jgi:HD-like signal output (HDOD) protein
MMIDARTALASIAGAAESGDIQFSTHAEIAVRVLRMLDDPDCAIDRLGKLVSTEPVLYSRVMSVANSIAYNPAGNAVTDIRKAISRLGFITLRGLAASVIVRSIGEASRSPEERALAARLWEHTAHVAALSRVIARHLTRRNPDTAFFAGIVHEIGSFYLIARAGAHPGLLAADLEAWREGGQALVGRAVLRALELPSEIVEAIEVMWSGYLASPPVSLGDTLLLADELSPVESPLDALAGMSRKGMDVELEMQIDDAVLSRILAESAAEVASLSAALKA